MAVGVIVVIGLFLLVVCALKREKDMDNNPQAPKNRLSNGKNDKIDTNFSQVVIDFFNGYLSLCKAHHVTGHAYMQEIAKENNLGRLDFSMGCEIFTVDGEHASDIFDVERRVIAAGQNEVDQQISDTLERIRKREEVRDDEMKAFYHCDDLFYLFCEIDEYEFNDPSVTIQCKNFSIFTNFGFRKDETLKFVKSELLKLWPEAKIEVGKYGMTIQA